MNKVAMLAISIAFIGGVWLLFARPGDPTKQDVEVTTEPASANSEAAATPPQSVAITYSDSGFNPTQVTIKVGDSVVFSNESSGAFWPASDPHPVHTALSDFDSRAPIPSGQSYIFTFEKSGTWGFHDHLNSGNKGSVSVK